MKCSLLTLSCALDGELSQERQAELETHLVTCERCRSGMRYLREETERISQLARAHVPPGSATAILERARVLSPEATGSAAPPPPEPDPVAVVEVPPLEDAPGSEVTGSNALPDLTLWGPGVAGATAAGALDSISVAGFASPEQAPEAPAAPEAEPHTDLLEPPAPAADLMDGPEQPPLEEADGSDQATSIESDITPWPAGAEAYSDQGVGDANVGPLPEAEAAAQDPLDSQPGSGWASSPLTDDVTLQAGEGWMPGASGAEEGTAPELGAAEAEVAAEGTVPAPDESAETVEDLDPIFPEGPAEPYTVPIDYQPVANSPWASDRFSPDSAEPPPPPAAVDPAPLERTDEAADGNFPPVDSTSSFWGDPTEAPGSETPPAAELPDQTAEGSAAETPSPDGYPDPILADQLGAPVAGDEPQDPDALLDSAAGLGAQADVPGREPPDTPADNPWTAQVQAEAPANPEGPWQRSWEPDPLPVWSPALPPIPPWPSESTGVGGQGSGDEVMEVAKEEAAGLEEPTPAAEVPVWIPPPPSLPSSVTDSWVPKRDLLDIPPQPPTPAAAEPLSPPVRPVDSVVPPRRAPSEETTGYQRIPPPHRPEGQGKRPVAPRPASPGPRSWTRTGTIAVAALAVFLIGWALTHHSAPTPAPTRTAHSSPTPTVSHSPAASPSAPATPAGTLNLTGEQTFGGSGSGYQMQTARYGLHQNGTQLWVVFQMVSGSGSPKITTGFDGATTLYVEMQGVAPGAAVPQPPSGELVTSVTVGRVPGFSGAVYILQLSRAAQVTGYLLPGTDTGSAGERVVLQLQ